jgi:hypothetical protein
MVKQINDFSDAGGGDTENSDRPIGSVVVEDI